MNSNSHTVNYRLASKHDFPQLASIYCLLYKNSSLGENWKQESALALFNYFYALHPDIFIVAEVDSQPIGAIMSLVKPWHDGNRLIETEVFVDANFQHHGIGTMLFKEHFRLAMQNYSAQFIEAHTYEESNGYPLKWYIKQGYKVARDILVIEGEISNVTEYLKAH